MCDIYMAFHKKSATLQGNIS